MKKIISLLLTVLITTCLSACSSGISKEEYDTLSAEYAKLQEDNDELQDDKESLTSKLNEVTADKDKKISDLEEELTLTKGERDSYEGMYLEKVNEYLNNILDKNLIPIKAWAETSFDNSSAGQISVNVIDDNFLEVRVYTNKDTSKNHAKNCYSDIINSLTTLNHVYTYYPDVTIYNSISISMYDKYLIKMFEVELLNYSSNNCDNTDIKMSASNFSMIYDALASVN